MPRISILCDREFARALYEEQSAPIENRSLIKGTIAESERLGFELGDIETVVGYVVAGIHALVIARWIIEAAKVSKTRKLEIVSPTTRISVDLNGRTEMEVEALVKSAMPFTK